jgi:hypothetical protein
LDEYETQAEQIAAAVEGRVAALDLIRKPTSGAGLRLQKLCAECQEEETEGKPEVGADAPETTPRVDSGPSTPQPAAETDTGAAGDVPAPLPLESPTLEEGSPAASGPEVSPLTAGEPAASTGGSPAPLIVDDALDTQPGQMHRQQFLADLRRSVEGAVDAALAGTGRSTRDCPYIELWFTFFSSRDSVRIDRTARRYAPEAARAATAAEMIDLVVARARRAAVTWAETGRITSVPDGVDLTAPEPENGSTARPVHRRPTHVPLAPHPDPHAVRARLAAGRPLDSATQTRMESLFGQSFSHVRLHDDMGAAALSRDLGARAFTVGSDVSFAAGEYRPGTPVGDALIAHELAHVVQQTGSRSEPHASGGDHENDPCESDADASAVSVLSHLWGGALGRAARVQRRAAPLLRSGLAISRCKSGSGGSTATAASTVPTLTSLEAKKTGSVAMTTAWSGACEMAFGLPTAAGVTFEGKVDAPAGATGTLEFVQLVNTCRWHKTAAGVDERLKSTGEVLDTRDPYGGVTQAVTSAGPATVTTNDSPGTGVGTHSALSVDDRFRIWLLWRPSAPAGAARVPLAVASWHWKATATKTGTAGGCAPDWTLSGVDSAGGTGAATTTLPAWTANVTSLTFVAGTCP